MTISDSVKSIGDYAFYGCTSLEGVYITDVAAWCAIDFDNYASNPLYYAGNLYLNGELVTDLLIPDGVKNIGALMFYGCTSITSVTIPNSVTSIGDGAFCDCTSLKSITIPSSVKYMSRSVFYNTNGITVYLSKGCRIQSWDRDWYVNATVVQLEE